MATLPTVATSWDDKTQRSLSASDPAMQLAVGAAIGAYQIDALLGSGGMGILYAAHHAETKDKVAIKVLHPHFRSEPQIVHRFFNEARAANQINHPNIVTVHDFVEGPNGLDYLVMELLEGADLWETHRKGGPIPLARALSIASPVAEALAAAHDKRIVHRDLKPENIFICRSPGKGDLVKLLDFGIAKLLESTAIDHHTRTGQVLGTPEFMAPEQALGARVDARADVYAFGVVLYWLLAGRVPLEGDALADISARKTPPPLPPENEVGEPIPAHLHDLVGQCLAFDREERLQSMALAVESLHRRASPPPSAPRLRGSSVERELGGTPARPRRLPLWLWAGVGAVALGASLWLLGGGSSAPPPAPAVAAPAPTPAPALQPVVTAPPAPLVAPAPSSAKPDRAPILKHGPGTMVHKAKRKPVPVDSTDLMPVD